MNAKNGRNAMNGNKILWAMLGLLAAMPAAAADTISVMSADKDGALRVVDQPMATAAPEPKQQVTDYLAPALYGLHEIFVQYPVFMDPRAANDCGLSRETLLTVMQRNLQDPNLEIMLLNESHERRSARADLAYEIYTSKIGETCLSFVNVRFTDRAAISLPPVKPPRSLTVTYWQKSVLSRSPIERHQTSVGDALAALGREFLRELKLAEPAIYSTDKRRPEETEEEVRSQKQREMMNTINESVSKRLLNQENGADVRSISPDAPPRAPAQR